MKVICLQGLALIAAIGFASAAHAEFAAWGEPSRPASDHDQARAALKRGEVVPLRRVLETVERQTPGDILRVELMSLEGSVLIYKLKVLGRDGRVSRQCVDARTGVLAPCPEPSR